MTRAKIGLSLLAIVAVGLRLAATRGDFVLDEIWSWMIAAQCQSVWEIVTYNHDNNHILNTLVIYALQPLAAHKWVLRLPAALASCLALWFGYDGARRRDKTAGTLVLWLLGLSNLAIVLGTEARGYGYLECCTLASWWALERYFERPAWRWIVTFGLAASLGFLSQLIFLFAYAGLALYTVIRLARRTFGPHILAALHILPLLTGIVLYLVYVEDLNTGGGNISDPWSTVIATLSLTAGGPETGATEFLAAAVAAGLLALSLAAEFRQDRPRAILFSTAIVIAPALTIIATGFNVLYPRHFLVPVLFGYVVVAREFARWWPSGRPGRLAVAVLLAAYATGNLIPVLRLIAVGRGQFSAAIRYIADESPGPEITLAGDHDFRNKVVAYFHADQESQALADRGKQLIYFEKKEYPRGGPDWYLQHSFSGDAPKPGEWTDPFGNRYELVRVFPSGSTSAWTWWVYRRAARNR